ncbi:hypothetical protein H0H92_011145 [Tricholoma furcatifolium]|nr:hypothetical protein H0H92_011145 [Tricholoma furcatifolium]
MRHRQRFFIGLAVALILLLLVTNPSKTYHKIIGNSHKIYEETLYHPKVPPPTYESLRRWEDNLPQHDVNLPFPEGKTGRYVKFSNQIVMLGWNNVLNEVLLNAHLAYESKRAYVFQDYVWQPDFYPWPKSQRQQNPPHTPLSALIGGTVVGQPFDEGDDAPRSVSAKYFDKVCPWHKRRIIHTGDIKPGLAWKQGDETFNAWAELLRDAPEGCIEVKASGDDKFPQTFDLWLWGNERILSLWESFSKSPTSRLLTTSPIVGAAVKRNEYLFIPRGPRPSYLVGPDPYERTLAMHVRRGDFKGACTHLAYWNSTFYSWNLLPELPDPLSIPQHIAWNSTEYFDAHAERCLPEFDQIIKKARDSRDDYARASPGRKRVLDIMYILTNEKGEWIERLREALRQDGWNTIVTSNDLELDSEGLDTNMAVDMEFARKAAVFIGNGETAGRQPYLCKPIMQVSHSARATFARYRLRFVVVSVVAFTFLLLLANSSTTYEKFTGRPLGSLPQIYEETLSQPKVPPPTYESLRKWEKNLPQHDVSLPFPEGKTGRYVKFSNQIVMLGWNNVLNEVLMNAHLAYASKRSYVFQDYVWKPEYYPWPEEQRLENPPHTPLGALIGGTVVGQPFDEGDDAPRSVSASYFDEVCPWDERRFIHTGDLKPDLAWKQGNEIFEAWAKLLRDAPERCIEIQASGDDKFPQTFDLWLWGSDRVLSLWDSFSKSPTSRLLTTSPIVGAAVKRNEYLFVPRGPRPSYLVGPDPYQRMLAMHIRRGDFKDACTHLAYWNSTFYSWNLLPQLPDPLTFSPHIEWNSTEYFAAHAERCLPDFDLIIQKARVSRDDYAKASPGRKRMLDIMYLLTNEKGEWIEKLKTALRKDGWNTIVTSNDLELDSEGIDTNMAIDMDIARKAAVFVGNGILSEVGIAVVFLHK